MGGDSESGDAREGPAVRRGRSAVARSLIMALKPVVFQPGDVAIRKGDIGRELYLISRGEVEVMEARVVWSRRSGKETSSAKSAS